MKDDNLPIIRGLIMNRTKNAFICLSVSMLMFLGMVPHLHAETWKVASQDWAPFSGKSLPEGGACIVVLRELLKAEGIDLIVEFYPWLRTIETGSKKEYVGVYPAYAEELPKEGFIPSVDIFSSPLAFAEPVSKPLVWTTLDDLKGKVIGVCKGYGTTDEFVEKVDSGVITVDAITGEAPDLQNLKKVAAGRVDASVIDAGVFEYYLNNTPELQGNVQLNSRFLAMKPSLVALNKAFPNKNAEEIIKRGLAKINPDQIIADYMKKYFSQE